MKDSIITEENEGGGLKGVSLSEHEQHRRNILKMAKNVAPGTYEYIAACNNLGEVSRKIKAITDDFRAGLGKAPNIKTFD